MSFGPNVISSWALPLVVMATRAEEHRANQVYGNGGLTLPREKRRGGALVHSTTAMRLLP